MGIMEVAEQRDKWSYKVEFVFSCVALSLGLGNIWRFPYLTYQNGGAAFLVPYLLLLMVLGRPMYFLELILGQFSSSSTIKSFACLPLAQCLPMVMMYAVFLTSIYYNVISCYTLTYVYYSLWQVLPWSQCNPEWTNKYCFVQGSKFVSCKEANESLLLLFRRINSTEKDAVAIRNGSTVYMVPRDEFESRYNGCKDANETSTEQFFYKRFLGLTSGIDELGGVQTDIFLALLVAWVIVFLAVSRGIRSSGKVAFVTVLVPFVMMVALLIRGATLTGVGFGTAYYLLPKWRRLLEYKVWQKAAEQVLISLGVAQGMVITMGSYNEFSNNANIDVYVIAVIDVVVSLVGGLVVFTVLGSMAFRLRVSMMDVLRIGDIHADGLYTTGLGLVFVAYPQAISTVSQPKLWAATFFAMLFLLTMGSQMAFVESLLSALKDQFENLHERRTTLAAVACCVGFLLGLPLTMQGGFYILNAIDTEVGGNLLRWIALFEIVYMIIGYGINRLSLDAEFMMDRPMGLPIEICWKFFCPILLLFVCISSIFETRPLTLGAYVYPPWVQVIGKVLFVTPVLVMAGGGVAHLVKWQGRWSEAVLPRPEWGPKDASTLLRYQLFLFDRAVLPPGKEWVDQEPLRKAALALGWQQHAEAEKDAVAAPSPASAGTVEAAQKEQMVEPSPAAVAIAGNSGNAAGAAKEVV
ncbi:sodium- and chloride-dependent glycine transporter 2-like isoform X2 [Dermacentor albipictus]|uniref:sodium- and chloride-dependent glycine transporter 2-like isoform X2 n=1 Tax=Dermacentor albipictus TaxID=60249 RepID=UPI0038FCFE92